MKTPPSITNGSASPRPRTSGSDPLEPRVRAMLRLPLRERVRALTLALESDSRTERDRFAIELVGLGAPHDAQRRRGLVPDRWLGSGRRESLDLALLALIGRWDGFSTGTRRLILSIAQGRVERLGSKLLTEGSARERLGLARMIADAPDPGLAPLAGMMLLDAQSEVAKAADTAFLRTVLVAIRPENPALLGKELEGLRARPRLDAAVGRLCPGSESDVLIRAVVEAVWSFPEHQRPSPPLATLLILNESFDAESASSRASIAKSMRRLIRLLESPAHPAHAGLLRTLRRRPVPLLRSRAWRLCPEGNIASAALERVVQAESWLDHESLLCDAHLALNPRRIAALSTLHSTATSLPLPAPEDSGRLSTRARLGVSAMLRAGAFDTEGRRRAHELLLGDSDPRVRLGSALGADPIDLVDSVFDPDPAVASVAFSRWASSAEPRWPPRGREVWRARVLDRLTRSPHPRLRGAARRTLDRHTPFRGTTTSSRLEARRWFRADPDGFGEQLSARIHDPDPGVRMDAIGLVRALLLGDAFYDRLEARLGAHDIEPRERASIASTFGSVLDPRAGAALLGLLDRPDARVRANAVEGLAGWLRRHPGTDPGPGSFLELKLDPHHRVRANAIRAWMTAGRAHGTSDPQTGAESLLGMLRDDRAAHRIAGLWAAERLLSGRGRVTLGPSWDRLARAVADLAIEDPEHEIRVRAGRSASRLLGQIRITKRAPLGATA